MNNELTRLIKMNEERKVQYEKIVSQQTEFGTDEIVIEENKIIKEETISSSDDIKKLIKKAIREKTLFRIKTDDGKFLNNNRFIAIKDDSLQISNPFVLFAEGAFPDEVSASFEDDGIDYSFKLKKYKSNGTEKEILCVLPDNVKILKRRGTYRIKTTIAIPVGIFWNETGREFIGHVNDISELGIGLKFDDCYFDFDFYNSLKNNINNTYPIILEIEGEYTPIVIKLKFINKNELDEIIVGAEFAFTENEQQSVVKEFVDKIRQSAIFQKKKDLTMQLIQAAEMGV